MTDTTGLDADDDAFVELDQTFVEHPERITRRCHGAATSWSAVRMAVLEAGQTEAASGAALGEPGAGDPDLARVSGG